MKLMIQFPTRSRPEMFLESFKLYIDNLSGKNDVFFNISCDTDDESMNNESIQSRIRSLYNNVYIEFNNNKNKIEAVNAGMENKECDVILNASDDMNPQIKEFDEDIRKGFEDNFPDYDGVLHFNDGYQGYNLNTLCILGKKYYNRFGYIYHPDYYSLYADNEFMEVSRILKKSVYIDKVIIRHEHATLEGNKNTGKIDQTYQRGFIHGHRDQVVFNHRKSINFEL